MDELTPQELNKFLSVFLITVRKQEDNEEYEPNSLRAFFPSFERHLKGCGLRAAECGVRGAE